MSGTGRRRWRVRAAGRRRDASAALVIAFTLSTAATAGAEVRVLNLLIEREGLIALHETPENGPPVMWLPQFRLFDADGRPLWSFTRTPPSARDFRRELDHRIASGEPLEEGRTLRQEARHFLRRGGLPFNLTTLPRSELTVVEYWTGECQQCARLSRQVDQYFDKAESQSVLIIRVHIAELE